MIYNFENTLLPDFINKKYFNCYEQQLLTICYFYFGEFWSLFIDTEFIFNQNNDNLVENTILIKSHIKKAAEEYYGISLYNLNEQNLTFDNNELYLIKFKLNNFPLSSNVEEDGFHNFLIYGKNTKGYLVYDNFYNISKYVLDYTTYDKGIQKIYLIKFQVPTYHNTKDLFITKITKYFYIPLYNIIKQAYEYLVSNNIHKYNSANLIDKVQDIASIIKRDSLIIEQLGTDIYLKECSSILSNLADKIRPIQFSILKMHIRHNEIPKDMLYQFLMKIINLLLVEKRVKNEVLNLLLKQDGLKELLHKQLLSYLEISELDDNSSVYENHDKLSIVYLLNYWEENNFINELEYEAYITCSTYKEFKLVTYRKILENTSI